MRSSKWANSLSMSPTTVLHQPGESSRCWCFAVDGGGFANRRSIGCVILAAFATHPVGSDKLGGHQAHHCTLAAFIDAVYRKNALCQRNSNHYDYRDVLFLFQ